MQIQRYVSKISGPLLDRIDIHIDSPRSEVQGIGERHTSREFIRDPQSCRDSPPSSAGEVHRRANLLQCTDVAEVDSGVLCNRFRFEGATGKRNHQLGLWARAYDRILKVSRTLSDLEGKSNIEPSHVSEAIQYRTLDRNFWA